MKLAISIVTYNRPKHIKEFLNLVSFQTRLLGIGVYIFDSSSNRLTADVVGRFQDEGGQNIYYYKYLEDKEPRERLKKFSDALDLPEAEYIWLCGDKFMLYPKNYALILDFLSHDYDIMTMYHIGDGIKYYDDAVQFFSECAVPLTHYGSTIIKKSLLEPYNADWLNQLADEQLYHVAFTVYANAIANKKSFQGVYVQIDSTCFLKKSRYVTPSEYEGAMWDIWVEKWYHSVMSLPKSYNKAKKNILCSMDKELHWYSFKNLLLQRSGGQYSVKKFLKFRKYARQIIQIPEWIVFCVSCLPQKVAGYLYEWCMWNDFRR